jgi:hypothetical protein
VLLSPVTAVHHRVRTPGKLAMRVVPRLLALYRALLRSLQPYPKQVVSKLVAAACWLFSFSLYRLFHEVVLLLLDWHANVAIQHLT